MSGQAPTRKAKRRMSSKRIVRWIYGVAGALFLGLAGWQWVGASLDGGTMMAAAVGGALLVQGVTGST